MDWESGALHRGPYTRQPEWAPGKARCGAAERWFRTGERPISTLPARGPQQACSSAAVRHRVSRRRDELRGARHCLQMCQTCSGSPKSQLTLAGRVVLPECRHPSKLRDGVTVKRLTATLTAAGHKPRAQGTWDEVATEFSEANSKGSLTVTYICIETNRLFSSPFMPPLPTKQRPCNFCLGQVRIHLPPVKASVSAMEASQAPPGGCSCLTAPQLERRKPHTVRVSWAGSFLGGMTGCLSQSRCFSSCSPSAAHISTVCSQYRCKRGCRSSVRAKRRQARHRWDDTVSAGEGLEPP